MNRLIPAAIINSLLDLAVKNKVTVEHIFRTADVDPTVVNGSGTFLDSAEVLKLFDAALEAIPDPAFGLQLGEAVTHQSMGLLGQVLVTSRNMGESIAHLVEFKDLLIPFIDFNVVHRGDTVEFYFDVDQWVAQQHSVVYNEFVAACLHNMPKVLTGKLMPLLRVDFRHPEPARSAEYIKFLHTEVRFSQPANVLLFPASQLDEPLLTSYPEYNFQIKKQAEAQLIKLEQNMTFGHQVERYLYRNMGNVPTTLEAVAQHFDITCRTLQRRLQLENTSFVDLRDCCRHRYAVKRLREENINIEDLARHLGFSDTSNFYHAFKRWEGATPGDFRKKSLQ